MSTERFGSVQAVRQLAPSLQRLLGYERFNLHRPDCFQRKIRDSGFDARYLPQNCDAFTLPCFWIPRRHLYVYGRQLCDTGEMDVFEELGSSDRVLFPIHPTSLSHHQKFLSDVGAADPEIQLWAVPTSSTRTLLAWPDGAPEQALFMKTSLYSPALGNRRLSPRMIGCSVGLSALVHKSRESLPERMRFCWESVGYMPRRMTDAGVIIRSIPAELKDDHTIAAPVFALLGGAAPHSPILLSMLKQDGIAARQFIEDILCGSFAKLWLEMSMRHGLILEAHGQDLMVLLSTGDFSFRHFVYRDFEGLQVDWDLRRCRGLDDGVALPRASAWYETYGSWGYTYGGLVFYKLITSLDQYLYFVIREFDTTLIDWQERGLIDRGIFTKDHVLISFSKQMTNAVNELFSVQIDPADSIHHSLKRFVIRLMKLRRMLIRS